MSKPKAQPAQRDVAAQAPFSQRTKVEMETSESGCFIAHVEDATGEFVVMQTEDAEQS